jgi:hypothetical protein
MLRVRPWETLGTEHMLDDADRSKTKMLVKLAGHFVVSPYL